MARILVADDAAMLRILVCRSLGGHKTIEAEDGTEALELIREHHPDIAILDWMMPGLTGVEVSKAIREDPTFADVEIVMMTARGGFDSEDQARAAGVDHFITKPIMPRQISTLVDRILASRKRQPKA
jgi:two-component system phosphate regulon response regulator PhoB